MSPSARVRVTILGCGPSGGVPLVGCRCEVCTSGKPKNHRTRASILIEQHAVTTLVDTSPDLRAQLLAHDIRKIDAILYTHDHADHLHGIDDVRSLNYQIDAPLPIYGDTPTLRAIQERFSYAFEKKPEYWYRPCLQPHIISAGKPFQVRKMEVLPFRQDHGVMDTLGFRVGSFAYSTDVHRLPEAAFAALEGIDVWIVDCLRRRSAPTHATLEKALGWIARVRPKRAFLTHMSHEFDYDALKRELPAHVEPAYDGMVVETG